MGEGIDYPGTPEASRLMDRSVLIVEDDEGLNYLAQKYLNRAGFKTQGVFTGSDALELVAADPNLMLLLDLNLPDMTGTELFRTLIDRGYNRPCVVMTGYGDEKNGRRDDEARRHGLLGERTRLDRPPAGSL